MHASRFWRTLMTICTIFSAMVSTFLAFHIIRARFSALRSRSNSRENSNSAIIMGIGLRFIGPTRVDLRDIEDAINHNHSQHAQFSHIIHNQAPQEREIELAPVPSSLPAISSAGAHSSGVQLETPTDIPSLAVLPIRHATKASPGRRALVIISALTVMAIIAGIFLVSVRLFSASLVQPAQVKADPQQVKAAPIFQADYERGVIYPQWTNDGYGVKDTTWQQGVATMKTQTGAQWIEIPVLFSQATPSSTAIKPSVSAPSIQSFTEGIQRAHELGYKVFFVPLMQVLQTGDWSGSITFKKLAQEQTWFDNYWTTISPYVNAAVSQGVEQMAIGTELQTLQENAPVALWNQLIARVSAVFKNSLTYDMNWSSLALAMPTWLQNSSLNYVGVSIYIPLIDKSARVDPTAMPALWQATIKTQLDALANKTGKQVLISEIGYRNSADALYQTWLATSKAKSDPQEQAGAFNAALSNTLQDTNIAGTFFWGWDDVGLFAFKGQPATGVLLKWYSMIKA